MPIRCRSTVLIIYSAKKYSVHFRTIKNFVRQLAEPFRNQLFSKLAINPEALGKIQISLDSFWRVCSEVNQFIFPVAIEIMKAQRASGALLRDFGVGTKEIEEREIYFDFFGMN